MKIYIDTIDSISKTQTLASHIKVLGKLELLAGDKRLKKLLLKCMISMQSRYGKIKIKSMPISLTKINNPDVIELIKYCNLILPKEKPEWQIIAIRHGWSPLNK